MGRPKKKIDAKIVEALAARFCTQREIAAIVGCDEKTIRNRFSAVVTKGRETGKMKLRKLQWNAAEAGKVPMLVFLGKQYLDQRDKHEVYTEETDAQRYDRIRERRLADLDRLLSGPGGRASGGDVGAGGNGRPGGNGRAKPEEPA
jgi:hypothetical protein